MKKKDIARFIVLSFIYDEPIHGYGITYVLEKSGFDNFMGTSKATIYNALKWLIDNNMATSQVNSSGNKPNKTNYSITELGKNQFVTYIIDVLESYDFESKNIFHLAIKRLYLLEEKRALKILDSRLNKIKGMKNYIKKNIVDIYTEEMPEFILYNYDFVSEHFDAEYNIIAKIIKYIKKYGIGKIKEDIKTTRRGL